VLVEVADDGVDGRGIEAAPLQGREVGEQSRVGRPPDLEPLSVREGLVELRADATARPHRAREPRAAAWGYAGP